MRKSIVVILILALAALFATAWVFIEDIILQKTHPLKYEKYVEKYSEEYNVPKEIIYAVIHTESGFDSEAKSSKGAVGLMQITESGAFEESRRRLGEDLVFDAMYNPENNIKYGTYYLSYLYHSKYKVWDTAIAAYNAGPTRVDAWLKDPRYNNGKGKVVNIPIKETADYVEKVNKAMENYKKLYFEKK